MLRNRGSRFDTGWLVTFSFFFILEEKNLLRNFLSVAKMASLVYKRENCAAGAVESWRVLRVSALWRALLCGLSGVGLGARCVRVVVVACG